MDTAELDRDRSEPGLAWRVGPPALVFAITVMIFARALGHEFVGWDDPQYLENNLFFRGFDQQRLIWMFTNTDVGHYMPIVWLSWALDYTIWGMRSAGYHLGNMLIHGVNAVLFYSLILALFRWVGARDAPAATSVPKTWRVAATFGALFFSLHPLRAESVAWATERKDVLLGLFYLLALLTYVRGRGETWRGSLIFFVLALLCKSMAATLPLVLLVLDVFPLGRLGGANGWIGARARHVWLQKMPFFVLSAAAAALVIVGHQRASMTWEANLGDLPSRCAVVGYGAMFYVSKTIAPFDLSPLYEMPAKIDPLSMRYVIPCVLAALVTLGLIVLRRRAPGALAAWLCYLVILLPVCGIVPVGPQIVADRYTYLSCLGFAALAAGLLAFALRRWNRWVALGPAAVVVLLLAAGTWRQIGVWHDSQSLWEHALRVDEDCGTCNNNLGVVLMHRGRLEEADQFMSRSIQHRPEKTLFHHNYGVLLTKQGRPLEAMASYRRALEQQPNLAIASLGLSDLLSSRGRDADAMAVLRDQAELSPNAANVSLKLAWMLATCRSRALRDGNEALALALVVCERTSNRDPRALSVLAAAYAETGKLERAVETSREAFRLAMDRGEHDLADGLQAQLREFLEERNAP